MAQLRDFCSSGEPGNIHTEVPLEVNAYFFSVTLLNQ
jgi:hypothetical protein